MGPLTSAILAEGLGFRHPSTGRGVEEVDLSVEPGRMLALVGPNGSGKSTLLGLLSTLLVGTGRLELFGAPTTANGLAGLRRRLGVVFDVPAHVDELSGRANASFFLSASGRSSQEADALVGPLLERLGLADVADEPVAGYSFGMRRKLALVEGLAHEPDLVLLDEPTVGLDDLSRASLWRILEERRAGGTTVVLATNELRGLETRVDRLVCLVEGRVVQDDTPENILAAVEGTTRYEIHCTPVKSFGWSRAGVVLTEAPFGFVVESRIGTAPLPDLLSALLASDVQVTDIAIRTAGLAEALESLTGATLPTASPMVPA